MQIPKIIFGVKTHIFTSLLFIEIDIILGVGLDLQIELGVVLLVLGMQGDQIQVIGRVVLCIVN